MEVKVIAIENIQYKNIFFSKGSILIESVDLNNWELCSGLMLAKSVSEIENDEDLFNYKIQKPYKISIPCNKCKFRETPWFGKVVSIASNDERVRKEAELAEKYWKIYDEKKSVVYNKYREEFNVYCKKIKKFVDSFVMPNDMKAGITNFENSVRIDIYRFNKNFASISFHLHSSKSMKKQYNAIRRFLKQL